MNKDKGFITIYALLVLNLILISVLYLNYITKLRYISTSTGIIANQVYNCAESKIMTILYDGKYSQEVMVETEKSLKTGIYNTDHKESKITINSEDLLSDDKNNSVSFIFNINEDPQYIEMISEATMGNITKKLEARISFINKLFQTNNYLLDRNNVGPELEEYMDILREDLILPSNLIGTIIGREFKNQNIYINQIDNDIIMTEDDNEIIIESNKQVFIINRKGDSYGSLRISSNEKPIKLTGLIYSEVDLIVENQIEFNGIIIINNGDIICEGSSSLDVKGQILYYHDEKNLENSNINGAYNLSHIKPYGVYLPNFIELNLYNIRQLE